MHRHSRLLIVECRDLILRVLGSGLSEEVITVLLSDKVIVVGLCGIECPRDCAVARVCDRTDGQPLAGIGVIGTVLFVILAGDKALIVVEPVERGRIRVEVALRLVVRVGETVIEYRGYPTELRLVFCLLLNHRGKGHDLINGESALLNRILICVGEYLVKAVEQLIYDRDLARGGIEVVGVGVEVAVEAIASALLGLELVEEPIAFKVVVLNGIDEFFARSYAVLEEQVNDLVGGVALGDGDGDDGTFSWNALRS